MAISEVPKQEGVVYRATREGKVYTSRINQPFAIPTDKEDTLPKQFLMRVRELGDKTAMRKKRYGIWMEYSWNDVYQHVKNFAMGLTSMGLQPDETVAIIGENNPEIYWTQLAVHSCLGQTVCVFSDALPEPDLLYVINSTKATFIVAQDQEQVDKALAIREKIPSVRRVIYWDEQGMWGYKDPWLMEFAEVEELGKQYAKNHPNLFDKLITDTKPHDTIILSMTSGTTSLPKFAMITNWQVVYGSYMNREWVKVTNDDNWLSFSPMAWLTEQAYGYTPHIVWGMTVNFPESGETVPTDLREIAPVGLLFPTRVWENLASTVRFKINDSLWLNRKLYDWFMPIAYQIIDLEDDGKEIPPHLKFLRGLGEYAVFQPLRDKMGLTRAKNVLTAGAMLAPDVIRFFRALGVQLRQLYASTETMGTIHIPGDVKLESVGVIVPGVELKIAEDQEILIRTQARFAGYYNAPDKTGEVIDEEGWYHTGDAGYVRDDGHLIYLERVKDMIQLASGNSFSPQYIEGRLKFSPYIADVMTIGGFDMDFVSAIIVINFDNVARWAEKRQISFTTMVDLSQKPEIAGLIKEDVERVNSSLPEFSRVRRFVVLHKAFDADEGELTRTRKLVRRNLLKKYGELLEAIYGDKKAVRVSAEVKYRDGRTGVVETDLNVITV
jgi:long-chain acyl-CoA synthetase